MNGSPSVQEAPSKMQSVISNKANKNLKNLKQGIRGMIAMTTSRPQQSLGPSEELESQEDSEAVGIVNVANGQEELNVEDLEKMAGVLGDHESMDLTDSCSGLQTSVHQKQQQRGRSKLVRQESPVGLNDWGSSGNTQASDSFHTSLVVGSDTHIIYKDSADGAATPTTPTAGAPVPDAALRHPSSAPVVLQTGLGYAPNDAPPQLQQIRGKKFLRGKIKISALKNLVGHGLDLGSSDHHTTKDATARRGKTSGLSASIASVDSDVRDHSRRSPDADGGDPAPVQHLAEEKAHSRLARHIMRRSVFGLVSLRKMGKHKEGMLIDDESTVSTFELPPPPLKSMAEADDTKPPAKPQEAAQLVIAPATGFGENEQDKRRHREKQRLSNSKDQPDVPVESGHVPAAATEHGAHVGPAIHKSSHRNRGVKLDPEARERLKKHSKENGQRYKYASRRFRQEKLTDGTSVSERLSGSDRLSSSLTGSDKMHHSDGQMDPSSDHLPQEPLTAEELAPTSTGQGKVSTLRGQLLRAPSGETAARKHKKMEDEKRRVRVRSRQSPLVQPGLVKEPSFSFRELVEGKHDDDQDSFADDIVESGGSVSGELEDDFDASQTREKDVSLRGMFQRSENLRAACMADDSNTTTTGSSVGGGINWSSIASMDVSATQGSLQHVESERADDYLQLVIGNNVPTKLPSPSSAVTEGTVTQADVVGGDIVKPEKKIVRRGSMKKLIVDPSEPSSNRKHRKIGRLSSSARPSGVKREGSGLKLATGGGDKKERSRKPIAKSRRQSDETGMRRRKLAARDSNGNASESVIATPAKSFEESGNLDLAQGDATAPRPVEDGEGDGKHPAAPKRASGGAADAIEGSDNPLHSSSGNLDEKELATIPTTAPGKPSEQLKEPRREAGREGRRPHSRPRKERRGSDRQLKKGRPSKPSSSDDGAKKPRSSHRGRTTEGGGSKKTPSSRGRSEAARGENRGEPKNRRRHSQGGRDQTALDKSEKMTSVKTSDVAVSERLGRSLSDMKW